MSLIKSIYTLMELHTSHFSVQHSWWGATNVVSLQPQHASHVVRLVPHYHITSKMINIIRASLSEHALLI